MLTTLRTTLLMLAALTAAVFAGTEIMHIGRVFEEKSLYSYLLKSGDTNASSQAALAHMQGMAAYGRMIGLRIGLGSALLGVLLGFIATKWHAGRSRHAD